LPHTYAVAGLAFKKLFENTKNQAIVISGESGAGKTENAKIAMKFLTSLSDLAAGSHATNTNEERIEDKILSCNPILEAFGNAKTVRNDNSSRFGKYVRMIVNSSSNHYLAH
jgi:myosin heavy subunit